RSCRYDCCSAARRCRCVKVTTKNGAYTRGTCVPLSSSHTGSFEWAPGPGAKAGFKGAIAHVALETAAHMLVTCTSGQFSGSYTGAVTDTLTLALAGCRNGAGKSCQSNATSAGEITTAQALEGELGFIKG